MIIERIDQACSESNGCESCGSDSDAGKRAEGTFILNWVRR